MRRWNEWFVRASCAWLAALMLATAGVRAQDPPAAPTFKPEEIEALVAPIALYPDSLLSQVLMASTYPLEIVYATRWLKANPKVKGEAAIKAVESQPWDVSVKSLLAFPQVLEPMNDKLDWTQKLGDAFLGQQKEVFAAVQRLRAKAQQTGNLKSGDQQKVIVEPATAPEQAGQTIVRIEPADPQVIYVPTYNPAVVYGSWAYPYYPPYYWPPYPAYYPYAPGAALATGLAWGIGFAAAGAIFGNCNWGGNDIDINVNRATNIDRNFDRSKAQNGRWQHDARHRQGVAYRDSATREKFAGQGRPGGRDGAGSAGLADRGGAGDRGGLGDRGGAGVAGDRGGLADRGGAAGDRGGAAGDRAGVADRAGGAGDRGGFDGGGLGGGGAGAGGWAGGGDHAFQGVGGGSATQRDFDRGRASTQPSGGGFDRQGRRWRRRLPARRRRGTHGWRTRRWQALEEEAAT